MIRKTPLKAKTPLRTKTPIKAKTELKAKVKWKPKEYDPEKINNDSNYRSNSTLQVKTQLKVKQKTARKLKEPYHSIFTDNIHKCVITGSEVGVVPHHIFGGENKTLSEIYGFILPLRSDWHTNTNYCIHSDIILNLTYKIKCQDYYINVLHKTKEDWHKEFGLWYELPKENDMCQERAV